MNTPSIFNIAVEFLQILSYLPRKAGRGFSMSILFFVSVLTHVYFSNGDTRLSLTPRPIVVFLREPIDVVVRVLCFFLLLLIN